MIRAREHCHEPALTLSGVQIPVMANVGCHEDICLAAQYGADGIGLYRMEQLYMARDTPPEEDELFATCLDQARIANLARVTR